jgi:hypothetical protein
MCCNASRCGTRQPRSIALANSSSLSPASSGRRIQVSRHLAECLEEWRTVLRNLPLAERAQAVLKSPEARGPALREPALSGVSDEVISHALEIATRENAPKEAAALALAEKAQELHDAAIRMVVHDLMETPFIVSQNGVVRKLNSPQELDQFLEKEVPAPAPVIAAIEEKEVDATEEAA